MGVATVGGMTLPLWSDEPGAPSRAAPRRVTLVRLAGEIARQVAAIGPVAVEGEVHRPTKSRTGWVFFALRDRAAEIRVVVPRSQQRRCRVVAGERALVAGSLEWTSDRGALQLKAVEVSPVGAGAVAALMAETRRRLVADGLVGRPKRRLPALPRRIGVICGADAAVRRDIESVVAARFPGYPLLVQETTVSGPGAPEAIITALGDVVRGAGVDVVILARGGGDATQLLAWSDEMVCRAVAACAVPVVSAIGHEGDRPLCDEVADLRCGTPSLAAAATVPDRGALETQLERGAAQRRRQLAASVEGAVRRAGAVDTGAALRRGLTHASERVARDRRRLDELHPRRQLAAAARRLDAVDWRRRGGERLGRAEGRLGGRGSPPARPRPRAGARAGLRRGPPGRRRGGAPPGPGGGRRPGRHPPGRRGPARPRRGGRRWLTAPTPATSASRS